MDKSEKCMNTSVLLEIRVEKHFCGEAERPVSSMETLTEIESLQ